MIADQCDYQVFLADAMPTDGYGCLLLRHYPTMF